MAHTPGPWRRRDGGGQILGGKGFVSVCNTFENNKQPSPDYGTDWRAEMEANARLIERAPELLDALKIAVDTLNEWLSTHVYKDGEEFGSGEEDYIKRLELLIAQVEGTVTPQPLG